MRPRDVTLRPTSLQDLRAIYHYVQTRTGSHPLARGYVVRLRAACRRIGDAPEGGLRRDDLEAGLRLWSFERRASIAYVLTGGGVEVTNIFYAGRDIEAFYARRSGHVRVAP